MNLCPQIYPLSQCVLLLALLGCEQTPHKEAKNLSGAPAETSQVRSDKPSAHSDKPEDPVIRGSAEDNPSSRIGAEPGKEQERSGPGANSRPNTDELTAEQAAAMAEHHAFMMAQMHGQNSATADTVRQRDIQTPGTQAATSDTNSGSPHPPSGAPIDCPLRKAGINPHGLKPFDEVEKYIAFLERPDRAQWQKPDAVVSALSLQPNDVIADIGSGSGYFSFRFADIVTQGRVQALDTEPEMVRHVHHKVMTKGLANIVAEVIPKDAPSIAKDTTVVFICDVLHHVPVRAQWLKALAQQMATNTRLIVIEFAEGDLPQGPPAALKIPKATLVAEVQKAGLKLKKDYSELLPYQIMLEFTK